MEWDGDLVVEWDGDFVATGSLYTGEEAREERFDLCCSCFNLLTAGGVFPSSLPFSSSFSCLGGGDHFFLAGAGEEGGVG